jgi:hypothetical protein
MEFKFSKGDEEQDAAAPVSPKKNQNALALLLVLLVGGFSYIYFFTGLLKPDEKPPVAAPTAKIVKMALPPREAAAPVAEAGTDVKIAGQKKNAAPSQSAPAPAPAPAKPLVSTQKTEPVKVVEKKPLPAPQAEKKAPGVAVATVEEKKGIAEKKSETVKLPVGETPVKGPWYVLIGSYTLQEELAADMGAVRKVGFEPRVKSGLRKKKPMSRLLFSESADSATARASLDKLKRITSDAFTIEHNGTHTVYAGSYLIAERATTEKTRLAAAGFPVTIKPVRIAIATQTLSVGPFTMKKSADAALNSLKKAGLKASLIHK